MLRPNLVHLRLIIGQHPAGDCPEGQFKAQHVAGPVQALQLSGPTLPEASRWQAGKPVLHPDGKPDVDKRCASIPAANVKKMKIMSISP